MRTESERLFYLAAGPGAALLIAMLLTPLRGLTPASNFTFAFMTLIIVVAELGGVWATLATAVVAVLSLNFFLTQPYLKLRWITNTTSWPSSGSPSVASSRPALGSHRAQSLSRLETVRRYREVVISSLRAWDPAGLAQPQLRTILEECTHQFSLAAAVIRDPEGAEIAASGLTDGQRPLPNDILEPATLAAGKEGLWPSGSLRIPEQGGRIPLLADRTPVGWLDVWGTGAEMSLDSRRALADLARLLAVFVVGIARGRVLSPRQ